jgi:RNA 3'-terminal phosphate cyclase (ATP)
VTVTIEPGGALKGISVDQPLPVLYQRAIARVAHLPVTIAHRELAVIRDRLALPAEALVAEEISNSAGPGNIVLLEIGNERFIEVIVGFGEKKVRAETVAENAVAEAQQYLAIGAPVGPHLADQLLLPLALAGHGCFLTMPLTEHSRTNIAVIQQFLEVEVDVKSVGAMALVRIGAPTQRTKSVRKA